MAENRKAAPGRLTEDATTEKQPVKTRGASSISTRSSAPKLDNEVELIDGMNAKIQWTAEEEPQSPCRYKVIWWRNKEGKYDDITDSKEYVMTELEPGSKYCAYVMSLSNDGTLSRASNTIHFDTAPKMPVDIKVENCETSPHNSLVVSFKDGNNCAKDMQHEVGAESLNQAIQAITVSAKVQSAIIKGLIPGESYSVYVRTTDEKTWSKKAFYGSIIKTYPEVPTEVKLEDADGGLKLSWKDPKIKPNHYKIYWEENGVKKDSTTNEPFFTLSSLHPSTTYKFRVASVNTSGQSNLSAEEKFTTAPAAPENVRVSKSIHYPESSFIVKYEDPDTLKKRYEVTAISMDGEIESQTTSETHTAVLNNLKAGRAYHICVVSKYEGLESERSFYTEQGSE